MRRILFLLGMFMTLSILAFSQKASIKGIVTDTSSRENIPNAVISILRAKDSILYKYTRAGAQGKFQLNDLAAGNYLILVTFPKYADYVEPITLTDTSAINVNRIILTLKAKLLEEVIVRQTISAIKVKGDTTEFTADSFHVQANATVEDLLKKLPGIQVDKNGKITAQGEKVQKVLVDGEEFFGDDPTLVTQNLRADMVDKVQVFDKKSDQAAFTGIDDGEKTKTLNIKLKDNKKNGYFGKISAGVGTDGYHDYNLMANYFKKKLKFSVYGIASNTGKTGLNWEDRGKYGESFANNVDFDESNGYFMFTGSNDELDSWNGQYNGQGYPVVKTGGLHFNNKWNDDKNNLNANYKFMQLNVTGATSTNTENILPDTLFYNTQKETFNNQILRNRLDGSYEYQIDSSTSIKISANGGTDHKNTQSNFVSEALASDSSKVNSSLRNINTIGDKNILNSNLLFKKKFHKKGRTLSVNLSENFENENSTGNVFADNLFYKGGIVDQQQITDQFKTYQTRQLSFNSKASYSEPLSKYASLVINYGVNLNNSLSNRSSFNKAADGKYTVLDSVYSNDYRFNIFTQNTGLNFNYIKKKLRLNLGNSIGFTDFKQTDIRADTGISRNFTNFYPNANFTYSFTQQKRLSFRYNGNTSQPSIQQIQPIKTNEDPLNINIGNPSLKPQFSNNLNINFFQYKVLTETDIYANLGYQFTYNNLSSSSTVDNTGKRINQTVNLNGDRSVYGYFGYGFKWKKPQISVNFNGNYRQSRNLNIVNGILNVTNSNNYTLSNDLSKSKDKKYELRLSSSATYTSSRSSVQTGIKTNYWSFNIQPNFDIYLPKKFQVHSDVDANFRQKTSAFDFNTNVILWNAWVGKKFFKKESLLLKITGNDLLNQNIGFNRMVNSNFITQNTYSTIQRYYMVSLVWNFTKGGSVAAAAPQQ